ncbi:glycoside hydrolase family 6 protein [Streptomyces tsukubensis]|uniref:Glucanase n=1 Tax=Streptomyces tsukubensis TaxID=83656 RepID=A0A1V4AFJ3_9ACTN|nr:glycoside hydrolase family 6 protein [Streptomyces tsukubensis]OON82403.1 endoglucanase [Streptomyces tsukubensis]QFR97539.1 endoglucanase [Streptomyces tsukubensis]
MVTAASLVAVVGTITGTMSALGGSQTEGARPSITTGPGPGPRASTPKPEPAPTGPRATASPTPPSATPSPRASGAAETPPVGPRATRTGASSAPSASRLYRSPRSQVLDWVGGHGSDPRREAIASRIASRPAAVWFADYTPATITRRVGRVTSAAAAADAVPVLVPYAIPDRDCGGASQGGAPDLGAYDRWIERFAEGLGTRPVIVILEPDSIAQTDCLSAERRTARYASLARAGRALEDSNPRAKVYYDAGHSGWHPAATMAARLRAAGAASAGAGVFTNVSNFHRTDDETDYARAVLDALGGPAGLGAVIDTSRNGNGAPADGSWCDPKGRELGREPTLRTGAARVDAYLWIKLPGESDGCSAAPGTFSPDYAYGLIRN